MGSVGVVVAELDLDAIQQRAEKKIAPGATTYGAEAEFAYHLLALVARVRELEADERDDLAKLLDDSIDAEKRLEEERDTLREALEVASVLIHGFPSKPGQALDVLRAALTQRGGGMSDRHAIFGSGRTTLNIDRTTWESLQDLAKRNERSASAEARIAIRNHIARDARPTDA